MSEVPLCKRKLGRKRPPLKERARLGFLRRFNIFPQLVFKAHRLAYHSTLGWRVIKKKI